MKIILDHANMVWFLQEYIGKSLDKTILFQKEVEDAVKCQTQAKPKAASQTNG